MLQSKLLSQCPLTLTPPKLPPNPRTQSLQFPSKSLNSLSRNPRNIADLRKKATQSFEGSSCGGPVGEGTAVLHRALKVLEVLLQGFLPEVWQSLIELVGAWELRVEGFTYCCFSEAEGGTICNAKRISIRPQYRLLRHLLYISPIH